MQLHHGHAVVLRTPVGQIVREILQTRADVSHICNRRHTQRGEHTGVAIIHAMCR